MEQLNKIEIRGVVGSTRSQRVGDSQVYHFTVATDYVYKDRQGEPVIETTWHNVTVWDNKNLPDLTKITKGSRIYVCGRLKSQKYKDAEGIDRYSFEIAARNVSLVGDADTFQSESL